MRLIRDNIATIVAGVIVAALLVAAMVAFGPWRVGTSNALVAIVHDGDGNARRLSLDSDSTTEITTSLGSNTVVVEQGRVRISRADCPHGDCTRQRPISVPGEQLICLPHELWVEVSSQDDSEGASASAHMDVDAVNRGDSPVDLVSR